MLSDDVVERNCGNLQCSREHAVMMLMLLLKVKHAQKISIKEKHPGHLNIA